MKTAQAFNGQNLSLLKKLLCLCNRVGAGYLVAVCAKKRNARPAGCAGVRLGVKAAVIGAVIFLPAPAAHLERAHCRVDSVVGNILSNRVARTL